MIGNWLREFRDFAMKGNVVDMAVGIIIGAAFGKIVGSLVNDVIMPPIGLLTGNMDFSQLFINNILDFIIVAAAIFVAIRAMNRLRAKQAAAPPPEPPAEVKLLGEIRDLLKAGR